MLIRKNYMKPVRISRPESGTLLIWLLTAPTAFARRHQQIARITVEAQDQQAWLTLENLAEILGISVRPIKRESHHLLEKGSTVFTRGQLKHIGPGFEHRVKAVSPFLQNKEPLETARTI